MQTLILILLAIFVLALSLFGLCINIIFKKGGEFPNGEISTNSKLRARGVVCAKEEDEKIWGHSSMIRVTGKGSRGRETSRCDTCREGCTFKKEDKERWEE